MRRNRNYDDLRKINIIRDYLKYPEGSVLVSFGDTKVICNATVENSVPKFLKGTGKGWIHAEYSMLPRSTHQRTVRESTRGKQTGRTLEISRLIARSLRSVVDLKKLGEMSIVIDCDVISADGGTRTTAITGGFVAMAIAINDLILEKVLKENPIKEMLAAISVGKIGGQIVVDLNYEEDSIAEVDMNIVMTENLDLVEIQGSGEESPFSREELDKMISLASNAIKSIIKIQKEVL